MLQKKEVLRGDCQQRSEKDVGRGGTGKWEGPGLLKFCEVVTDPAKPSTDTFFFFVKHIKTCDCVKWM